MKYILLLIMMLGCDEGTSTQQESSSSSTKSEEQISEASCLETFKSELFTPVLEQCVTCHKDGGVASTAGASFNLYENNIAKNYTSIQEYISDSSDLLLSKPTGVNHQGGAFFTQESDEYRLLLEWINRIKSSTCNIDTPIVATSEYYKSTQLLSLKDTYKKASIFLSAYSPSKEELDAISSKERLKEALISSMKGSAFKEFLMTSANDKLLVKKYLNDNTEATSILDTYHYPQLLDRVDEATTKANEASQAYALAVEKGATEAEIETKLAQMNEADEYVGFVYDNTQKALAMEPLELIAYVVMNDKPYSEILTADYMMLNPFSSDAFGAGLRFKDNNNPNEFKKGKIKGYVFDYRGEDDPITLNDRGYSALPISGVLTSPIFLARYPSTATNKNRARSRVVYKMFLGVDIESLAVRSMDPEELKKSTNPGDKSSSCYGCHIIMDPIAGAFYNWGDNGHFKEDGTTDSLPESYKESELYQEGDVWYRDNIKAGFETLLMPTIKEYGEVANEKDGLIWLAKEIVKDERFAKASVEFWYEAIFSTPLVSKPTATQDSDFEQKLARYNQQEQEIAQAAKVFLQSNQNLKEMLAYMIMSERFRVSKVEEGANRANLRDVGVGHLLTPEQLDRKIQALTGYRWSKFWDEEQHELLNDYYMFYGGIDSDGVSKRASELTTLMAAVIERMSNEIACPLALKELDVSPDKRKLFGDINPRLEPTNEANILAIKKEIQHLHEKLLGEKLALDDEELVQTYNLFYAIYYERKLSANSDKYPVTLYSDDNEKYKEFCFTEGVVRFDDDVWEKIDWSKALSNPSDANSPQSKLGLFYSSEQTMRAWIAVLSYMLNDYKFIVE